jgi:NAD(P)-dependent dehydrogenase (short-subunit alcohol dehydrogenase family)
MKKTVFITGASSGFGKETAKLFQNKGWNVIASMRSPENEKELSAQNNVVLAKVDVTDKDSIQQAIKAGIEKFGAIDVLINNAGYGAVGALEAASDKDIREQFEVNLFGVINVTREVLPVMRKNKEGVIINVSSMGGKITLPFGSLYHATKFALEGLTEALQYELNPFGIRLKIIEPGSYRTDFAGRSINFFGIGNLEAYKFAFDKLLEFAKKPGRGNANIAEVSDVIYQAATDNSDQLRYPIGADAIQMIQYKHEKGDVEFKKMLASQLGL